MMGIATTSCFFLKNKANTASILILIKTSSDIIILISQSLKLNDQYMMTVIFIG